MSTTRLQVAASPTAPTEVRVWLARHLPGRADIELAVHEALCNCLEHAGAAIVTITLCRGRHHIAVDLVDDGRPWVEPRGVRDRERGRGLVMIDTLAHSTEQSCIGDGNRLRLWFSVR